VTRRSNFVNTAAPYAAVGASHDPNLVRFPPDGFSGFFEEVRLGIGGNQFQESSDHLLSWEAQHRAGFRVDEIERGESPTYLGLATDAQGNPISPRDSDEVAFSASGNELLTPGTTAVLKMPFARRGRLVRVMFTLIEERKVGFALGTLDRFGFIGEVFFYVEHRSDQSVWAVAQGFVAASDPGWLGLKQLVARPCARFLARSQIRSLKSGRSQPHKMK